jgi:hypothetical protein
MTRKLLLLAALAGAAACIADLEPEVGPPIAGQCKNEDSNEEIDVSFKNDVLPLLQMRCGCHDPKGMGSGYAIELTGYSVGSRGDLMKGGSKTGDKSVVPGDACSSILVQKCSEAVPFGSRMPLYGPYFSMTDMALLRDWIVEGAHDN